VSLALTSIILATIFLELVKSSLSMRTANYFNPMSSYELIKRDSVTRHMYLILSADLNSE
jgi:hypothetical protein